MPRRPLASFIAVVLAVGVLVACGDDDDDNAGTDTSTTAATADSDLTAAGTAAMASVCDAVDAAAATDPAKAEQAFQSIHDRLHEVGDALTGRDRAGAEAFLRAKSTVEADFTGDVEAGKLTSDLGELANQLALALDALAIDAPGC